MKGIDYRALGHRIRERRQALKLNQLELAQRIGVSTSFVGHMERAEKIPSLNTIVRLGDCLGMSLDELVLGINARCDREKCPMFEEMRRVLGGYGSRF